MPGDAKTVADDRLLETVIAYMENTDDDSWGVDVVRSKDGARNCFFGHIFDMARDEKDANRLWDWFENTWATTYRIYPVNDGENPDYQQPTPKARVLAFLRALADRTERATWDD